MPDGHANVLVKVLSAAGLPWGLPGPSVRSRSTVVRREVESPYPARCVCPVRGSCAAPCGVYEATTWAVLTMPSCCACSGPPPGKVAQDGKDGWSTAKLPDGRMVWVATPKNAVERISCILVIERKSTTARYYCLKCKSTFFGSKKRIIEHLRCEGGEGKDARNCTVPITPEEAAICLEDDEQDPGGASREAGADGEGSMEGSRKRKKPAELESRNPDCNSPFPGDEPAPEAEGWRKVKDPRFNDGRLIWVALPKNEIERMPCVYVVERRATTSRYLCIKCNFMYWGSKKRIKEHLRDQAGDVKGCTVRITPEEEDTLQKDDSVTRVRTSRASRASAGDGLLDNRDHKAMAAARKIRTGPGKYKSGLSAERDVASPFLASEPPPEPQGWTKAKAPDGTEIWVSEPKNSVERLAGINNLYQRL